MKASIVKKEYQDNLKDHLEQRLYDLIYQLKHEDESLSIVKLNFV